MIYFVIRILVNAVAAGLTIWLVPGIKLAADIAHPGTVILVFFLLGILFGLINAFIRPLVLFITGRLVITTMGLFTLLINGLLFYLIPLIIPDIMQIVFPSLLWATLAGTVMGSILIILEALLGLDSPKLEKGRRNRFYWRWLGYLPENRRRQIVANLRLQQVYATIRRYGIDILVSATPFARLRRSVQRLIYPEQYLQTEDKPQMAVRRMLEELGPTFIKFGQIISSRSEILPEEWQEELSQLQSQAEPFSSDEASRIILQELGAPPGEIYAKFDPDPFAAASMSQIHHATLQSGEQVVVKVERPDIDVTVRGDLTVMKEVVATMEKRASAIQNLGLSGMVEEFANTVTEELDYIHELYNAQRLQDNMQVFNFVHIPVNYPDLSSTKVLTMEYVKGVKMTEVGVIEKAGYDRDELARRMIRVMNQQVLLDGYFHGDPHPGNVLLNLENGEIIFLDLGMMGQLTDEQRMALFDIIWSLKYGDSENLTRILLKLSTHPGELDENRLSQEIDIMVRRYVTYAETTPQLSQIVQNVFTLLYRYGIRLERSLTIALKSLMQTEELVRTLASEMSFIHIAVDEVQSLLIERLKSDEVYEKVKESALRTAKDVLVRMPAWKKSLWKWVDQFEEGKITVHLDAQELNQKIDQVDKRLESSVRLIVLGLLLLGMLVSTAIVSTLPMENLILLDFLPQDLFVGLFILVAVLGLIFVIRLLWSTWRNR